MARDTFGKDVKTLTIEELLKEIAIHEGTLSSGRISPYALGNTHVRIGDLKRELQTRQPKELVKTMLKPGDLVRAITTSDCLIKVGSLGFADGYNEGKNYDDTMPDHVDVCFNPQDPWIYADINKASVSGGPEISVFASLLVPTEEFKEVIHHVKGQPRNNEERLRNSPGWRNETAKVRIWEVDLMKNQAMWKKLFEEEKKKGVAQQ